MNWNGDDGSGCYELNIQKKINTIASTFSEK